MVDYSPFFSSLLFSFSSLFSSLLLLFPLLFSSPSPSLPSSLLFSTLFPYPPRLSKDEKEISKRPLLRGPDPLAKLNELSDKRREKYLEADVTVPITFGAGPAAIADDVVLRILQFIKENPPMWQQWKQKRESVAVDAGE